MPDIRHSMLDAGYWMLDTGSSLPEQRKNNLTVTASVTPIE
jgi:hypothetical protein